MTNGEEASANTLKEGNDLTFLSDIATISLNSLAEHSGNNDRFYTKLLSAPSYVCVLQRLYIRLAMSLFFLFTFRFIQVIDSGLCHVDTIAKRIASRTKKRGAKEASKEEEYHFVLVTVYVHGIRSLPLNK